MPTYRLNKVRHRLEELGAVFEPQHGRPHATIRCNGRTARWPNPHDDPINDFLLSQILKQLGISRREYFNR